MIPLFVFTAHFAVNYNETLRDAMSFVVRDYGWYFGNQSEVTAVTFVLLAIVFTRLERWARLAAIVAVFMSNAFVGWFLITVRGEGGLTYW